MTEQVLFISISLLLTFAFASSIIHVGLLGVNNVSLTGGTGRAGASRSACITVTGAFCQTVGSLFENCSTFYDMTSNIYDTPF